MDPEGFRTSEMAEVVGDNRGRLGSNGKLDQHVISRVAKKWSPEEEDPLANPNAADVVDDGANLRWRERAVLPQHGVLVLEYDRDREGDLKVASSD